MPDLFQYRSPWMGVDVSQPEVNLEPGATPYSNNFDYVLGELRTRNPIGSFLNPGVAGIPGGEYVRSFFMFRDIGFALRFVAIGNLKLYSYSGGSYSTIGTPTGAGELRPLVPAVYNGVLYWPTGTNISSWNGTVFTDLASIITGGKFIGELASHLVVLNTTEAGPLYFPQRVRWSASGLPTQFDPTVNTNAGYVDLDVPDAITGFVPMGTAAWIMRTDGITQMIPTGNGIKPFDFLPLLGAPVGVGNYYPWSLDSFGLMAAFISRDDVYLGNPNGLRGIGGTAREAIFADLANAPLVTRGSPYLDSAGTTFGSAVPVVIGSLITNTALNSSRFLTNKAKYYVIAIPNGDMGPNVRTAYTVFWKYDIERNTWLRSQTVAGTGWQTSNIRTCQDPSNLQPVYTIAGSVTYEAL